MCDTVRPQNSHHKIWVTDIPIPLGADCMKKKSTIHVWLLLLLGLGGLAGVGWYAHASSPPVSQLMPVLGDAYGPVVDNLDKVIEATRPTEAQPGNNGTAVAGSNVNDAASSAITGNTESVSAATDSSSQPQVVATTDQSSTHNAPNDGDGGNDAGNQSGDTSKQTSARGVTTNSSAANGADAKNTLTGSTKTGSTKTGSTNPVDVAESDEALGASDNVIASLANRNSTDSGLVSGEQSDNNTPTDNVRAALPSGNTEDGATALTDTSSQETNQASTGQPATQQATQPNTAQNASPEALPETLQDASENNDNNPDSVLATLRETELALLNDYVSDISFTAERWSLNETTRSALSNIFETLFLYSDVNLAMDVHVTDTDDSALNQVISEQRASAILGYLMDRGLASDRIQIKGQGDAAQNDAASAEVTTVSGVTLRQLKGENQ